MMDSAVSRLHFLWHRRKTSTHKENSSEIAVMATT